MNCVLSGDTLKITGSGTISKINSQYTTAKKVIAEGEFTRVDDGVFSDFQNLEELILPDSITYVGNFLLGCTKVKTFHIPLSLNSISIHQPFDQAEYLESFTIDPNHEHYAVVDDVLYSKDMKTLICYPGGKKGKIFTIPDGVTEAFNAAIGKNSYLKHVIVPPTVVKATNFGYLSSLENITLFRCDKYENDEFFNGISSSFKGTIINKTTPYQFSLNGDGSILTVYPMKGCHYSRNNVLFEKETMFIDDSSLVEVIFKGRISSTSTSCFKGCTNLKNITFPSYRDICFHTRCIRFSRSPSTMLVACIILIWKS